MEITPSIKNNSSDYLVQAMRASLSIIPFAGSFLAEIVGNIIPNQRLDRICKYLEILNQKVNSLQDSIIQNELKEPNNTILLEKSIIMAANTNNEKTYEYYSEFIVLGIKNKSIEQVQKEKLLSILSELNEIEIIHLIYHSLDIRLNQNNAFVELNKDILYPEPPLLGTSEENYYPSKFNEIYLLSLEKHGLIEPRIEFDRDTNIPKYNHFTGKPEIRHYEITMIGQLLAKLIGAEKYETKA